MAGISLQSPRVINRKEGRKGGKITFAKIL